MLAKLTAKDELTLPKSVTAAVGNATYFEVEARDGRILLTPVHIQPAEAVRSNLAELNLTDDGAPDDERAARRPGYERCGPQRRPAVRGPLDAALLALGRLDGVSGLLPDVRLVLYTYVRKEAVLSSACPSARPRGSRRTRS
jgi:hypothetical protein